MEARLRFGESPDTVTLRALAIRKQNTGVHARLTIYLRRTRLAFDLFNVERSRERKHLAGEAVSQATDLKMLNGNVKEWRTDLEHELMTFADGLWTAYVGTQIGGYLEGEEDPQPPDYLLEPYCIRGGGTFQFGPPKAAKSYTALLWAVSMDAGVSKFWQVQQCRVQYINLERSEQSMKNRLGLVNRILGLPPTRPLLFLNRKGRTLADIAEPAKRMIADEGVEHSFVDSLSRAGAGDLTHNEPANEAMDLMNGLIDSWTMIAHTARGSGDHVFGSQMFDAAADILVKVRSERQGDKRGVGLSAEGNDVPYAPLRILAYEFERHGLVNVREAHQHEFPHVEDEGKERNLDDTIVDQLLAYGVQNGKQIAADLDKPPSTIGKALARLESSGKVQVVERQGRGKFFGVSAIDPPVDLP